MDKIADLNLKDLMVELYTAFNNGMPVLAAIGVRTSFDRATEILGIDPSLPFVQKLDQLATLGMLSGNDRVALAALIDAGSAAAHRGWKPTDEALSTMLHILEAFVHKEIVLDQMMKVFLGLTTVAIDLDA